MFHRQGGMHPPPFAQQSMDQGLQVVARAWRSSWDEEENSIATLVVD